MSFLFRRPAFTPPVSRVKIALAAILLIGSLSLSVTMAAADPTSAATQATADSGQGAPAGLRLTGITPSPLYGSDEARRIVINGTGFVAGSMVALSRAGEIEVMPPERVTFIDQGRIAVEVTTGTRIAGWAVQVSTPDNRRSNVLPFQVVAAPAMTQPSAATAIAPPPPAKSPAAVEAPAPSGGTGAEILGSEWLANQPAQNFTLQLLASHSRYTARRFAGQAGLAGPLALVAMESDGMPLQLLLQGSYPTRAEAEQAAKGLPAGIRPWIRSISGVRQVMKPEAKEVAGENFSGTERKDLAWVWSQNPQRYTVQLAAAGSEEAIETAMRHITLAGELAVVQTRREGKPWYALIYGSFAGPDTARGVIERLPESLRQAGPWARRFATLHEEISRATPE
jgi:septal ring-binding cell division protein DamX